MTRPGSRPPGLHEAGQELRGLEVGPRLLPGALAPAVLPGAALVLTVPGPIEEVGTGAKDLPIEDAAGALGEGAAIELSPSSHKLPTATLGLAQGHPSTLALTRSCGGRCTRKKPTSRVVGSSSHTKRMRPNTR